MNINSIQQRFGNFSNVLLYLHRRAGALLIWISKFSHKQGCVAIREITFLAQKPIKPSSISQTLGDHIKKRRLELKLLQKEVASKLGVDESTITNWEKGHSKPMLHLMPKVIDFLGYDPTIIESKTLGEKVLQYRKSHGMTQKELARQIGIDPTTLSRIEYEKEGCLPETAEKVENFLGNNGSM